MILSFLFIVLAAIFKAVADTVADHFSVSIFKGLNPTFWNKAVSWQYAVRVFNYPVDAWHLSNSAMIACFILSFSLSKGNPAHWLVDFSAAGILFVLVFNVFYNKVLKA